MADMYDGFRPWELLQGGFSQVGQGIATGMQEAEAKAKLKQPLDPRLSSFYEGLLSHLSDKQQAPAVQGVPQLQGLSAPQLPQFTNPQNAVPDVGIGGVQAPGSVSPSGGPQGPLGARQPSPVSSDLQGAPSPSPGRGTGLHKHVDNILYGGQDASAATGAAPASAAPTPQAAPQAAPPPAQDPRQPTYAKSTQTGQPRPFTNADLPMLEKLLPVALARMQADTKLQTTGMTESGKNQRTGAVQLSKQQIAELRAKTGSDQFAAKLQADLAGLAEKLDVSQQQAYLKAMVDLAGFRASVERAQIGADGKVKAAGAKPKGGAGMDPNALIMKWAQHAGNPLTNMTSGGKAELLATGKALTEATGNPFFAKSAEATVLGATQADPNDAAAVKEALQGIPTVK